MQPGRAVERALQGRNYRAHAPELNERTLRELERRHGGPKGAAAAAGVSRETWRRWTKGIQAPKRANLQHLLAAVQRSRVAAGRRRQLLAGKPLIYLHGTFRFSDDETERCGRNVSRVDNLKCRKFTLNPTTSQYQNLIDHYDANDVGGMDAGLQEIVANYAPELTVTEVFTLWMGADTHPGTDEDDDE